MKDILKNKRILAVGILVIIIIVGICIFLFGRKEDDLVDIGNILNEQASQKSEDQLKKHYMIVRNTTWGTDFSKILTEEDSDILDYQKDKYITCDYETLLDMNFLPTYLFDNGKLVAILYEADLSSQDTTKISLLHQDLSVNIHYIYENLYRENNKWSSGQERKYDTNLWSDAILNGKLVLQSVWNSNDEKVFLLTSENSYFGFLEKNKERDISPSITFLVISDDYLQSGKSLNDLVKITPSKTTSTYDSKDNNVITDSKNNSTEDSKNNSTEDSKNNSTEDSSIEIDGEINSN